MMRCIFFSFFFPVRYVLRLSKKLENSAVACTTITLPAHFDKNHGIWRNAVLLQRRLHISLFFFDCGYRGFHGS